MSPRSGSPPEADLDVLIDRLDTGELRAIVRSAAARHDEVARSVRLAVSGASGDLVALRAEIDRGLRAGRFLGYYESRRWAVAAGPVVEAIGDAAARSPSPELITVIERAIARVVKVILKADDSDGLIGGVASELLGSHAQACDAGVADPVKLARWMTRFSFDDQDFFHADPVRYGAALGDAGLAAYRQEVRRRQVAGDDSFAVKYAEERLAVLDGDSDAIIRLLGGDLTKPYQFIRVAEAMAELGRDDDVLAWATRGITETEGWQLAQLYDLAAGVHARRGDSHDVLRLRRDQHYRMPSQTTYGLLRQAAENLRTWEEERPGARVALTRHDPGGLVDVLLGDGEPEAAWQVTLDKPDWNPGEHRWLRLAEARKASHPADTLEVYLRIADAVLETTGRAAYQRAAAILKKAARAAKTAGRQDDFTAHLAVLRDRHRRRPTFLTTLDKARLG